MSLPASEQVELEAPMPQCCMNTGCQLAAGWLQTKWYQDETTTAVWVNKASLGTLHSSSENRTSHKPATQPSLLSTSSLSKIHHRKINMKLSHLLLPVVIQGSHSLYSNLLSLIKGMALWRHFTPIYLSMKQGKKGDFCCSLLHPNSLCQVPNKGIIFFCCLFCCCCCEVQSLWK